MVAAEQVLEECMHIQKAPRGAGNTQDKQHVAAPLNTVPHTAEAHLMGQLCVRAVCYRRRMRVKK
jgi:hypothetical protein